MRINQPWLLAVLAAAAAAVIFAAGVYVAHALGGPSQPQHLVSQSRSRSTGSPSPSPSSSLSTTAHHKRRHPRKSGQCYDSCGQSEPIIFSVGSYSGTEPTTIDISGDSGDIVTGLTWQSWPSCSTQASCNGLTAVGNGTVGIDNCQPNCAEGTVTQEPTTITLSDPIVGTPTVWGYLSQVTAGQPNYSDSCAYPHVCAAGAS